jgi:hypothetical protein
MAEALHYQRDRRLDDVPGLPVGLQLKLSTGNTVYVALAATEFSLYFDAEFALHYDLELRLTKVAHTNEYWRRGLSHRGVYARKLSAAEGGGLERTALTGEVVDAVVTRA